MRAYLNPFRQKNDWRILFTLYLLISLFGQCVLSSAASKSLYLQLPTKEDLIIFEIPDPPQLNKEALQMRTEVINWRGNVSEWFLNLDDDLGILCHLEATYAWRGSTNVESDWTNWSSYLQAFKQKWMEELCLKSKQLNHVRSLLSPEESNQINSICDSMTPVIKESEKNDVSILNRIYNEARVCVPTQNGSSRCLHGEPDLALLMKHERDPQSLLEVWSSWREAVGPPSLPLYPKMVLALNDAARSIRYADYGKYWKDQLDVRDGSFEEFTEELRGFYLKLHGFVRHHLRAYYGEREINAEKPIPAHLLGNMWAQSWRPVFDIILSKGEGTQSGLGLTQRLRELNFTVEDMAKEAESFMTSMDLPAMLPSFWKNSQFTRPKDVTSSCHPSAINMFAPKEQDFRLQMCGEVDEDTFLVMHHEMGHIEYYMAYDHLPNVFKDSCHPSFHEAIGDSISYGVLSPVHLQRLGIQSSDHDPIKHLLYQALEKIPIFFWSLVVDYWRYDVFSGEIGPELYNEYWWKLREEIQGVTHHGKERPPNAFDPVSKFHIADNSPYLPYFLSGLLQVQLFRAMCEAEYGYVPDPLMNCDIYGSSRAGNVLRSIMEKGKSEDWKHVLREAIGVDEFSTDALMEYYAPLIAWLDEEIFLHNITIGWK